ncbi:mutants block sporulation after engulfment [Thermosinus carboxydivorans Nor1]|uniref:Mutants block sporulation after engulfment n=1 Tax=Thermosinus carboxydivorans Nor1 TaxID=401526 RepID=A1HQ74_9FIRM|nr:stage III sporulation protein AE [Thermosinus carboxydivorans]EAX47921.1 mutants block sporulation after engulfment [Thermosinus carboxydivorans Nor1]
MKIVLCVIMLLIISGAGWAAPLDQDGVSDQLLDKLSLDNVNNFIRKVNHELQEDIPLLTAATIKETAAKGLNFDWSQLWQKLISRLFRECAANIHLLGKLLFLAVLCALLQNLQNSFEQSTISLLAYGVCFIFLAVIALNALYNALTMARETVDYMVGMMEALLPLLLSLLAGVGALTSAALFTPLMLFVVSSVGLVVKDVVLPLLILTAVLECVNFLSDKYRLSNLAGFFKQGGMVVLGLTLVIFIGIITIQGVAGSVADGITLRTAKYATSTFIPVVGKMFADTVELVMGASLLIKNAIGIFGVMAIITVCAFPLIKLMSLILVIKIAGALVQPLGDEKMAKCLDGMGNNLLLVFGAVLTVALMLFLAITMIVGAGSLAVMLR